MRRLVSRTPTLVSLSTTKIDQFVFIMFRVLVLHLIFLLPLVNGQTCKDGFESVSGKHRAISAPSCQASTSSYCCTPLFERKRDPGKHLFIFEPILLWCVQKACVTVKTSFFTSTSPLLRAISYSAPLLPLGTANSITRQWFQNEGEAEMVGVL